MAQESGARLPNGTRLGPYVIEASLGAGGMGEVYRARDSRLDRTVAVKVLTGALAADSESRQRFEHEARAIAALNDPHICTIHDVGRHEDLDYLVLEHLEGETLADRLRRPPALSLADALALAIQIGDALARAHRAGIVHRDLKPGNVMLVQRAGSGSPDVKLLDFGLAARMDPVRPAFVDASLAATMPPSQEATRVAAPVATGFGGTLQYMAPEQLNGDPGDHRVDIFAFGCVLYEMLAGRKAFDGATPMTVIAAITTTEPAPIAGIHRTNPALDHVLRRALEKDRERRWQSIADMTGELRWSAEHPGAAAPPPARSSRAAQLAILSGIASAAFLAGAALFGLRARTDAADAQVVRFEVGTAPTDDPSLALSPDGTRVAFVANRDHVPVLWLRALDGIESRPLPGTEGATLPFWSPDGRTIAFFAQNKVKRIDVAGGTPLALADAPNPRGGAWSRGGVILFASGVGAPISRVSAQGGAVDHVTEIRIESGPDHRFPVFLPDGERFIFVSTLGTPETNGVYVGALDKRTPVRVVASDGPAVIAAPDRLLTIRQGALLAYNFDARSAMVQGEPVVVAQGFMGASASSGFAASDTGVLAYRAGIAQRRQLAWVDRTGATVRTIGEPQSDFIAAPELSADEQSVVVYIQRNNDNDIWVIELARNLARRLTNGPPADAQPLWDPDGQHVVFFSRRFGGGGPARVSLTGAEPEPMFAKGESGLPQSWTKDRGFVLIRRVNPKSGADLIAVATKGDPKEIVIAQSHFEESEGQFSPDGKWVALVSNEGGRQEVFLQSFPDARTRTQVSTGGGSQVRWSVDGKEIFYIAPDEKMMSVTIDFGGIAPQVKLPVALFQTHLATGTNVLGSKPQYAVSRDGRFLLNTAVESAGSPIVVAVNWMKK